MTVSRNDKRKIGDGTVRENDISDIGTKLGKGNMSDVPERRQYGTVST